jgi:nitrate/nitrite-specific signal transduction histidine kinase
MSHEHDPSASAEDPLRLLRELLDRVAEASRAVLGASARSTPDVLGGPLAAYIEGITGLTEKLIGPLEQLLEEQHRIAERMADWSEQHRRLSEEIATWAERHRQMTQQMQRLIRPALDEANRMSEMATRFADDLRR